MSQTVQIAAYVTTLIGALTGIAWVMRTLWRGFSKVVLFATEALGDPKENKLGIFDRMEKTEAALHEIKEQLGMVDTIGANVHSIDARVTHNEARLTAIEARFPETTAEAPHHA